MATNSVILDDAHRRYYSDACLMASAPDLLTELQAAHKIIRNALACMSTAQKARWGKLNADDCVDGEGITRAYERASVIEQANFQTVKTGV